VRLLPSVPYPLRVALRPLSLSLSASLLRSRARWPAWAVRSRARWLASTFRSRAPWLASTLTALTWLSLTACDSRPALREWQASDHQPPPSVAPEGQGTGSTGTEADDGDPNARAAAALWGQRCASCHGDSGRGDGSSRPPGARPPDLTVASYNASRTDAELHTVIKQGRNMMPAFADQLTDLGIDALVKHVRTLSVAK